jgi:hypothetical protein
VNDLVVTKEKGVEQWVVAGRHGAAAVTYSTSSHRGHGLVVLDGRGGGLVPLGFLAARSLSISQLRSHRVPAMADSAASRPSLRCRGVFDRDVEAARRGHVEPLSVDVAPGRAYP